MADQRLLRGAMRRLSDYDRDCVPLGWRKSSSALDAGRTSSRGTIPRRSSSCHQPANRSPALRDGISTRRTPPGYSRSHRQHRPMGWLVDLPEPHRQRNRREPRVRRARVPWRRSGRGRRMRGAGRRVRLRSGAPRRGVVPGRGVPTARSWRSLTCTPGCAARKRAKVAGTSTPAMHCSARYRPRETRATAPGRLRRRPAPPGTRGTATGRSRLQRWASGREKVELVAGDDRSR